MMPAHPLFDEIIGPYRELLAEALEPVWPTSGEVDAWHRAS